MDTTKAQKTLDAVREKVRAWAATVDCDACFNHELGDAVCQIHGVQNTDMAAWWLYPNARREKVLEKLEVACPCDAWIRPSYDYCGFCLEGSDHDDDCQCQGTEIVVCDLATMLDVWPASEQEAHLLLHLRGVVEAAGWELVTYRHGLHWVARIVTQEKMVYGERADTELDAALDAVAQAFEVTL